MLERPLWPSSTEAFAIAVVVLSVISFPSLAADPGLGWHLKIGQLIAERGGLPRADPFLWPVPAGKFILNQWLPEVIGFSLYQLGGWGLLHALTFLVVWAAHLVVPLLLMGGLKLSPSARLLGILSAVALGSLQWMIRPQILSFLLFGLVLVLARSRTAQRVSSVVFVGLSALTFLVWANCHPGFLVGFAVLVGVCVQGAFGRQRTVVRDGLLALLAALLASLLNPLGYTLFQESSALLSNEYFMNAMSEWKPPTFENRLFLPFWIVVALGVPGFVLWTRRRRDSSAQTLDWFVFLVLVAAAFEHRRFLPFVGVASVLPIASTFELLRGFLPSLRPPTAYQHKLSLTMLVVPLIGALTFGLGVGKTWSDRSPQRLGTQQAFGPYFPVETIRKLDPYVVEGDVSPLRILNNPNWGGVITWKFWPHAQVFVDDRNELNGERRYRDYYAMMEASPDGLRLFETFDFDAVVLEQHRPLKKYLLAHEQYRLVSEDTDSAVFVHSRH